jgi:predicted MFS family arabinose efflux permease
LKLNPTKFDSTLSRVTGPLSTLRQRDFGFVWTSIMLVGMGTQMETLVVAWFVLAKTNSPFLVGLVSSVRLGANFLALFAGALADRLPRRLIVATAEFAQAGTGLIILILLVTGALELWHLYTITFLAGTARIFQMPAAQSLAADSVGQERISTGVALITMGMNLNLVAGPLLGGILFELAGPEGAYAMISALYVLAAFSVLMVKTVRVTAAIDRDSVWSTVVQGLRYVKGQQVIWGALVAAVIINLTGFPFHGTLVPIFARNILGQDAAGLGLLISGFGIGAVTGSMFLSMFPNLKNVGKLLILSVVVWHVSMAAFSASTSYPVSLGILVVTGFAFSSSLVLIMSAILRTALPEFRGRIVGLRVLAIYASALGSMNSGAMAGTFSPQTAANVSSVLGISLIGILALIAPKLRRF